ncbi:MAG: ABC transporter substrate-binding protein [Ferruginibacter sp.]|nr:ABC transporter substrate-binding protein [Ferruginibacter sp.]
MLFTQPPNEIRPAQRIVSVIPSITELLFHLGLNEQVIGITPFCVHPQQWHTSKKRIGGPKKLHVEEIISLKPDLVIAGKEENIKEQIEAIAEHAPVFLTDVVTIEDALGMINDISLLTGMHNRGCELIKQIKTAMGSFKPDTTRKAVYVIWKAPYMCVGGDTFIHYMMEMAGFINVFAQQFRYPVISIEDMINSRTEIIILSSEPYPFKEIHAAELRSLLPQHIKIILADGEMFSWYGSRMLEAVDYFKALNNKS